LSFTDVVVNAVYAALASRLLDLLRTPARTRAVQRVFGSVFIALGVLLATFKRV
jgi:homoserine/homoserine lactone efflux protein